MTTARTTKDLIAEAEATEAALLALWEDLKSTLPAPDAVKQKLTDGSEALARGAQTAASTATQTAKAHPIAAAALMAGAAWLLLGAKRAAPKPSAADITAEAAEAWKDRAIAARNKAQKRLEETYGTLRSKGAQTAEDVAEAGAAKLAEASDLAKEKATITADLARDLSEAFHHGLSSLGEEARDRILQAREQSFAALARRTEPESLWQKGQSLARNNPTSTAVLGLAAGLGLAWMMPRSRAALRAAAPGAIGVVVTPAAALVAQNLIGRAAKALEPFTQAKAPDDAEAEEEAEHAAPVAQAVKDAAKAAAMAGVAKAVGEAIGKAGAERASKSAAKSGGRVPEAELDPDAAATAETSPKARGNGAAKT